MQTITGTYTPTAGVLAANGYLTLKSTASSTASVAAGASSGGYITGNVIVERYLPAKRAYRFLTPSVTTTNYIKANWQEGATSSTSNPTPGYGTHISGHRIDQTDGFDGTLTGTPSLYTFNNTTQAWASIASTNATNLVAGNAYRILLRGDRTVDITINNPPATATTLRATGSLTTGTVTMNSTGTGTVGMPTLSSTVGAYSFIGNPYASSINWDDIFTASSGVEDFYYVWDPTRSTRGAYVCWDKSDATTSGAFGSNVNQYIQQGQAVFTKNTTTTPVITISESNKSTSTTSTFRTQTQYTGKINIGLTNTALLADNNGFDGATLLFADNFSAAINSDDIPKITNQDENLAIYSSATNLMKESRPTVSANDTVRLKIWQLLSNDYILTFDASQFAANKEAYLLDAYLNTTTPINLLGNMQYAFTKNTDAASYATNRFSIVFKTTSALPVNILNVTAAQKNAGIEVSWNTATETNMASYEVEESSNATNFTKATTVAAKNGASNAYNWFDATVNNGDNYYRIKAIEQNGTVKYSNVVKVKIGGKNAEFTVYPNPVKNGVVSLQMSNVEQGVYTIKIYNNAGQEVANRTITSNGGSSTATITLGKGIAKGNYNMQITNGTTTVTKSVIVD
jgi:hypothetical protein